MDKIDRAVRVQINRCSKERMGKKDVPTLDSIHNSVKDATIDDIKPTKKATGG